MNHNPNLEAKNLPPLHSLNHQDHRTNVIKMRVLPDPHQGLHPALPKSPPPLLDNVIAGSPIIGGAFGSIALFGSLLTRRKPALGIQVAALTTTAFSFLATTQRLGTAKAHKEYLKAQGIEAPNPQLVERWRYLDQENIILAGGLAGILLRLGRVSPGGLLARWTRSEVPHVGMTTEVVGSFSFGSLVGVAGLQFLPLPGTHEALLEVWKDRQIAAQYQEELRRYEQKYSFMPGNLLNKILGRNEDTPTDQPSPSPRPTLSSLFSAGFASPSEAMPHPLDGPQVFSSDIDSDDPKPHHSELIHGKRLFIPSRNHEYVPASVRDLESHLTELRTQRDSILPEAELIWHKMAVLEGQHLPLKNDPGTATEAFEDMRVRALLRLLNNTHTYLWSQISDIDWMIADTNKQILQLRAKEDGGKTWEPGLSREAKEVVPRNAVEFLAVGMAQQRMHQGLLEGQMGEVRREVERVKAGLPKEVRELKWGEDPRRRELDALEQVLLTKESVDMFVKVGRDLVKELGKGEIDVDVVVEEVGNGEGR